MSYDRKCSQQCDNLLFNSLLLKMKSVMFIAVERKSVRVYFHSNALFFFTSNSVMDLGKAGMALKCSI